MQVRFPVVQGMRIEPSGAVIAENQHRQDLRNAEPDICESDFGAAFVLFDEEFVIPSCIRDRVQDGRSKSAPVAVTISVSARQWRRGVESRPESSAEIACSPYCPTPFGWSPSQIRNGVADVRGVGPGGGFERIGLSKAFLKRQKRFQRS